jgi:hypothetical protein
MATTKRIKKTEKEQARQIMLHAIKNVYGCTASKAYNAFFQDLIQSTKDDGYKNSGNVKLIANYLLGVAKAMEEQEEVIKEALNIVLTDYSLRDEDK